MVSAELCQSQWQQQQQLYQLYQLLHVNNPSNKQQCHMQATALLHKRPCHMALRCLLVSHGQAEN
jgi:hypothetical protein